MKQINDLLNIGGLKIVQNDDYFKFSLDSILLAAFANVKNKMEIVDFCSGNLPVPLFLSNKINSNITAIELQKEIYDLAKETLTINNLEEKILLINDDIKNFSNNCKNKYDLITCNPPYFEYNSKKNINNNKIKAYARHEIACNLKDVFECARKILKNHGKIDIIHRTDRLIDVIFLMKNNNIEPKRIKFIYPSVNKKSNLVLVEGSLNGNTGLKVEEPMFVHNSDGTYTEDVIKLFNGGTYEN